MQNTLKIPEEVLKPRRTNQHYLQAIEAITFYHQYQREKKADPETGEIYIETTLEDIAEANKLMKNILLRKSDELTGACRTYLEKIKSYLSQQNKTKFTNAEVRKALRINASNQKRYTLSLLENFYIKRVKGSQAKGYEYEVNSCQEFEELQDNINHILEENLKQISYLHGEEGFNSLPVVQNENEPHKQKKTSKLKAEVR